MHGMGMSLGPPSPPPSVLQLWILLTLCTFSALPWMIVELRKQHFSVHYQGEHPAAKWRCLVGCYSLQS